MNDSNQESALNFPCKFPIKIMGKNTPEFEASVMLIFRTHVPDLGEGAFHYRHSKDDTYLSITVTINATSKTQLETIYQQLSDDNLALMVL